jgi:general secretion pathway protein K
MHRFGTAGRRDGRTEIESRAVMRPGASRKMSSAPGEGGFIVVAVLWIIIALATLVSIYAVYVVRTSYVIGAGDDRVNAEALFTAAVELTAYQLTAGLKEKRPVNGRSNFRMGRATVGLEFHSEGARIDLNEAPKELLSNFFVVLGVQPPEAQQYADRIMAWRTPVSGENAQADSEADAYRIAGRNYLPRRAPFQNVGELWLVLGLPPALVERALPYVTVFNGRPQVNILDAPPVVLAALPGMAEQLNDFLKARESTVDGQVLLEALGAAKSAGTIEGGKATRITVSVQFDSGRRASAEIVILVDDDDVNQPYRVLSWRDDFDQLDPIVR